MNTDSAAENTNSENTETSTSSKKNRMLELGVAIWIVFSMVYVANDQWSKFKTQSVTEAFNKGRDEVIAQLLNMAEKCEPIDVANTEKKAQFLSLSCLTKSANGSQNGTAQVAPTPQAATEGRLPQKD